MSSAKIIDTKDDKLIQTACSVQELERIIYT